ncbi:unnamed protein product [Gongylonema pulchrum]|uniref:Uncharacterized protein n=1 Tax=Gongylonema pulchrum TaxID=637853 RepID=A0A183D6P8_9BILA|nr:unnamed protein product [Gongylonema pulchrum]
MAAILIFRFVDFSYLFRSEEGQLVSGKTIFRRYFPKKVEKLEVTTPLLWEIEARSSREEDASCENRCLSCCAHFFSFDSNELEQEDEFGERRNIRERYDFDAMRYY